MAAKKAHFTGHSDCVYSLTKGLNKGEFLSAGADGLVVQWSAYQPDEGKLIAKATGSIYASVLQKSTETLAVPVNRDGIHLINPVTSQESLAWPTGNTLWFRGLEISDSEILFCGSNGQIARVNTVIPAVAIQPLGNADFRGMAIHPAKEIIALGDSKGKISLWNHREPEPFFSWQAHPDTVFGLVFYPDGLRLVSAGKDAHLRLWQLSDDFKKVSLLADIPAHLFGIHDVVLHPTRPLLASAGMDKTIKIWDAENLKLLRVLDKTRHAGHGHSINQLLWLNEPELLLSCSDDRTISAWEIFE